MALQKTASGKVDKRTKEYKELVERAKKARAAQKKTSAKPRIKKTARRSDGHLDQRTKAGKEAAARMAKARKAKGSLKNKLKRLFK
jgi:hypothetical protein